MQTGEKAMRDGDHDNTRWTAGALPSLTRRGALRAAASAAALTSAGLGARQAAAQARTTTTVAGFETTADVAKAEQEGELLFYTHDGENAGAAIVEAFSKDFPKIRGNYVRAQNGALYSKVLAERSAGRFNVDVIQFSEVGTAIDFQKRGGYERYVSPQMAAYAPEHLSTPSGDYTWVGVTIAGICYNTTKVQPADAPKTWKDLLDPRWRNAISTKQSTSGTQFVEWYELRRLYGDEYWKAFAKQRPRGFDSRAQLFDRLAKGDDKVCALAEWAGYVLIKQRGAPVAFVAPEDGLPASQLVAGVVSKAPHPEAARLFLDWLLSTKGQTFYQENPYLFYGSVRKDAPAMPGDKRLSDFKLLVPTDMPAYLGSHDTFTKEWNAMLGL
jgi:iron(III) transport system substrate-binding protein